MGCSNPLTSVEIIRRRVALFFIAMNKIETPVQLMARRVANILNKHTILVIVTNLLAI